MRVTDPDLLRRTRRFCAKLGRARHGAGFGRGVETLGGPVARCRRLSYAAPLRKIQIGEGFDKVGRTAFAGGEHPAQHGRRESVAKLACRAQPRACRRPVGCDALAAAQRNATPIQKIASILFFSAANCQKRTAYA